MMNNYYAIRAYLLVDVSGSVRDYISRIDAGVRTMIDKLCHEELLTGADIYLTVLAFDHRQHEVKVGEKNFRELLINSSFDVNQMEKIKCMDGATDIGKPLNEIIEMATEQYQRDKGTDIDFYHPIIALFTDGRPDAGLINGVPASAEDQRKYDQRFKIAAEFVKTQENMKKLNFIAFYFGENDECYQKLLSLSNYKSHIIRSDNVDKAERFFSELIVDLINHTITDTQNDIYKEGLPSSLD